MAGSWTLVNRNRYLSGSQKLVQARMYAQGSTLVALLTSFAIEGNDAAKGTGRWETIKVLDPNDPEHKHLIEKRIHHERYAGEDQWRGKSFSVPPGDFANYCRRNGRSRRRAHERAESRSQGQGREAGRQK